MRKSLVVVLLISGCTGAQMLSDYRPAIDPVNTDVAKFEADLPECRSIASAQYDKYMREARENMVAQGLLGALTGAMVGAVAGSAYGRTGYGARTGAALGSVYGVSKSLWEADPRAASRRVVDRCLIQRGHTVISDLGRG